MNLAVRMVLFSLVAVVPMWGCGDDDHRTRTPVMNYAPWPMHPIDSRFRGANALGAGDVNKDGLSDYVTNYEFDQRYVVVFHPGPDGSVREPWPSVVTFVPDPYVVDNGVNPESAALGDVDGDGNVDVVAGQGWGQFPFFEGSQPGIRVIWGPEPGEILNPSAWLDAGRIPATVDDGHFHWVQTKDVDGDGLSDIVAGGRVHGENGRKAGVRWFKAPAEAATRRDLGRWRMFFVDPNQPSGHGFVFADIDADGDDDIVLANADFDTPEESEVLLWYENPGTGSGAQMEPWPSHEVFRSPEFDDKPQVAVGDLDGDGLDDLVMQTAQSILYFRKTSLDPVQFERVVISKPAETRQFSRPIRIADLNADGRKDLVGMLVHEGTVIASDKFAAFWMEYEGREPRSDNWTTHVIKYGSGKTMFLPTLGEKWDQVDVVDVDSDGDLDLVANCEEWWEDGGKVISFPDSTGQNTVAVVWFENRLAENQRGCIETEGLCVVEAEHYADAGDASWFERAAYPGYSGNGYMQDNGTLSLEQPRGEGETRGFSYRVEVEGGTYRLWVRRWVPAGWGANFELGSERSDSAWIGVDGSIVGLIDDSGVDFDRWVWVALGKSFELSRGRHEILLRAHAGGYAVDRLLLSTRADYVPAG